MIPDIWSKLIKSVFIAGVSAAAMYLQNALPMLDFGAFTPVVQAAVSVGVAMLLQVLAKLKESE